MQNKRGFLNPRQVYICNKCNKIALKTDLNKAKGRFGGSLRQIIWNLELGGYESALNNDN